MGKVSFGGSGTPAGNAGLPEGGTLLHNPSIVFWGNGQDSKLEDEDDPTERALDCNSVTQRFVFLRWEIREKYFGATDDMIQFIAGEDVNDIPFQVPVQSSSADSRRTGIAFKMKPGYWSFNGDMKLGGSDSRQQVRLMRVVGDAGDADELLAESIPGPSKGAEEPLDPNTGRIKPLLKTPPIKIGSNDIIYLVDSDITNDYRDRSQFLDMEYFGP